MNEMALDERCMSMINYGYIALRQFPKRETHVLGAEIRASMLKTHRLIITAGKRYHKKTTLTDLDIEVAMLQRLVRLAKVKTFHSKYKKWEIGEKEINQSMTSWLAHASHADARGLCAQLLKQ